MKCALICGGAACLADDLEKAAEFGPYDAVFVVNVALAHYSGPIDYAVSLHPELFPEWMKARAARGFPMPSAFVAHKGSTQPGRDAAFRLDHAIEYLWHGADNSGSSGLFAVKAAKLFGFERRILAGTPMDPTQGYIDDPRPWVPGATFWRAWEQALPHYGEGTRSLSGNTMELLGYPDRAWRFGAAA